jgi:hypothetical protein
MGEQPPDWYRGEPDDISDEEAEAIAERIVAAATAAGVVIVPRSCTPRIEYETDVGRDGDQRFTNGLRTGDPQQRPYGLAKEDT